MLRGIFQIKKLDDIMASAESGPMLRRDLGAFQVTLLGIGAIVGAGIFATLGTAAAGDAQRLGAGPSLMLSFVITAVVCAFTALCYAEFAALVPISGSAYTYSYATLGELVAWIIGWDLIIEYAVGNVAVAISWANYFRTLLESVGIHFPLWLATDFRTAAHMPGFLASAPHVFGVPIVFNLLAFLIVALITVVLVVGIRESARFNAVMVMIKIVVLLFFVAVALKYVTPATVTANWHPFQPNGWKGTFAGAAVVFFAYIGFDAVSTVSEETRNPGRNLPIGIIASLIICTVLYIGVAAVFSGIMPYAVLKAKLATEQAEPLTMALAYVMGGQQKWVIGFVALGSVIAHTAVLLVFQLGQPRIFFSMARDGLLPQSFARVHPKYRTPHVTTILTGVLVGGVAAFASIDEMVDLTNIGTLFAFVLVCVGVPILRHSNPNAHRPFKVPFGPYLLPLLGAASCVFLMYYLPPASWWRFVGWLVLGFAIYSAYGYTRSTIGQSMGRPQVTPWTLKIASLGFLLTASGLFTIPHDAGLGTLMTQAGDAVAADHTRSLIGLALIVVGLVLGAAGLLVETRDRRTA